jgi:MFS family permease
MPHFAFGAVGSKKDAVEVAQAEAPEFERVSWWRDGNLRVLYWHCCILLVASATTGYDGQMLNTSQLMDTWQTYFDEPTGSKLGVMNNAFNIGSIVSFFFVPFFTDRFGRKWPIVAGCLIMVAGGFVTAFAKNWGTYLGGRVVLGFGNSFAQMCSPILLTEICHPQHRARLTAVYNCLWNLGSLCEYLPLTTRKSIDN